MRMIAGAPAEIRSGFRMQMNDYRVTRLKTCKTWMQTKPSQNRRRRFGPGTWWHRHPTEYRRSRAKPSQ
jgi:hypothetical protein